MVLLCIESFMNASTDNYPATFNDIYNQYYKKVLNYLSGIIDKPNAEEVAQDTFIKVHNKLHTLKDRSKLSPWIYKIALNSARDRLRKESKLTGKCRSDETNFVAESTQIQPDITLLPDKGTLNIEELIYRSEMISCYISFVKKLPRNYFEIFVLSSFDGFSNKAIAEKLSLSLDTVKIRLHRAKTLLYESLRTHCHCYRNEHGELWAERK
jgi:RNA polymerase sigma-70 factor, ECF subfamily